MANNAPLPLDDSIIVALRRISQAVDTYSRHLLHEFSLTAPQIGALRALQRLALVGRVGGRALYADAFELCLFVRRCLGQRRERRRAQHQRTGQAAASTQEMHRRHQVSDVSTSRRALAMNAADCISRRRDTVRGNSCASGPSVYRSSGATAADTMSLTRRS